MNMQFSLNKYYLRTLVLQHTTLKKFLGFKTSDHQGNGWVGLQAWYAKACFDLPHNAAAAA